MKKSLLALSLLALGSLQLSAAPCQIGVAVTLATLGAAGCELTNGANTWNLTTFGFSQAASYTNYPGFTPAGTSGFNVTFGLNPTGFNGGFSVALTSVTPNYGGFFTSPNASGAQQGLMETTFRIGGNSGTALLTSFGGSLENPTAPTPPLVGVPNPAVTLQKFIQQLSSIGGQGGTVQLILQPDTSSLGVLPGSSRVTAPPVVFNSALIAPGVGTLVIIDRLRLDSGNTPNTSASITGYTNYFAPTAVNTGVPEPMTFALMGAGLIGLAVLRRRK